MDTQPKDHPLWQKAAAFAAKVHAHQLRKDGATPYVSHPFRVAMTVRDVFNCQDQTALVIALLHDTVEDTTVDYDDINEQFGTLVADCVAALTKNKMLREDLREKEYDARLAQADWRARLVKLADTFDNLSDVENKGGDLKAQIARLLPRCERAVALAQQDLNAHEETVRGVAAVRALMASVTAG